MRKIVFVLCLALLFAGACRKDSEKYIALVNDGKLDRVKFDRAIDRQIRQGEKSGQKIATEQKYEMQKSLLDRMVMVELLLQEAKKADVVVSEEELNKKMAMIKGRYAKPEDFEKALRENDVTEGEIRDEMRTGMIIDAFLKKRFIDTIQVDETEIRKIYAEHKDRFHVPEQVRASHILLKTKAKEGTPEAGKEGREIKDKLGAIRKDILDGKKDFAAAAREFSDCPSRDKGGDLGFFPREVMAPEFSREAFSRQPGSISQPFQTRFGFHLLTVTGKQPAHQKTYDEAKEEIRQVLTRQKSGAQIREYVESIRKNAKVTSFLQEPPSPPPVAPPSPAPDKPVREGKP